MTVSARRPMAAVAALLGALAAIACSAADTGKHPTAALPSTAAADTVATVNGAPITMADLDGWIKDDLYKRETADKNPSEMFELRSDALDRMIAERLLAAEAAKRGITVDALQQEEAAKTPAVTEEQMKAFFEENKARVGNQTYEQLQARIRQHLEQQARNDANQKFVAGLREAAGVSVALEQPRIAVAADGVSRGPADAPVTIIEFSDYQCPFCRRAEPTMKEVLARYPEQVRFVYRHFPLDMHPRARPAAEASLCAAEQGRFWEFHDKLFSGSGYDESDFERYAVEIGIDPAKWKECRDAGRTKPKIDADLAAGQAAGVTGTPAFFVNGLMLSGARPLDAFTKVIDAELARAAATPAASAASPGAAPPATAPN